MPDNRGSEKLMAAWKSRIMTDDSVQEIVAYLAQSPAKVEQCAVYGGANANGVRLILSYEGDNVPRCGNDLSFWLQWHRKHGGIVKGPVIFPKGIPYPELVSVILDFGHVAPSIPDGPTLAGTLAGTLGGIAHG